MHAKGTPSMDRVVMVVTAIVLGAWHFLDRPGIDAKYRSSPAKIGDVIQAVSANGTLNPVVLVKVAVQLVDGFQRAHHTVMQAQRDRQQRLDLKTRLGSTGNVEAIIL